MRRFVSLWITWACLAVAAPALADEGEEGGEGGEHGLPLRYQERPLTLPRGELSIDAELRVSRITVELLGEIESETFIGIEAGAAYGITDDLQVDALVLPLLLDPELEYENPIFGATYRFLRGDLELGASLHLVVPVQESTSFEMQLGVPLLVRLGRSARLDTGLEWNLVFADETTYGFGIPVAVLFQVAQAVFVGPVTGLAWDEMDLGDTAVSPLGVVGGYSIAGPNGHAMLDILVGFHFPMLFTWGEAYPDTVTTDLWTLTAGAQLHLGLGG